MARPEYTDEELSSFHIKYFVELVLYQIMTIIQITLVISTIIQFQTQKNQNIKSKRKWKIKYLFVMVLSLGSVIFLVVEWFGIADFLYNFAKYPYYCDIAAILENVSMLTYLLALYLFYLYRLYVTFKKSPFQLSSCMLHTSLLVIFAVYFGMIALVLIFQRGEIKYIPFAWSMKKSDYEWIATCKGEFSIAIDINLRIAIQCIVIAGNIFFGYLFYKKLYDLLKFTEKGLNPDKKAFDKFSASFISSNQMDIESCGKVYNLMNKQTTLVMVSTVSTSILWTTANVLHYHDSFLQVLLYLDIFINCLCLWLMFPWNDKLYTKYCKLCAAVNHLCCSRFKKTHRLRQMANSIRLQEIAGDKRSKIPALHIHPRHEDQTDTGNTTEHNVTIVYTTTAESCATPTKSRTKSSHFPE